MTEQQASGDPQGEQQDNEPRARSFRATDKLWDAAMDACRLRGDPNLSHVIRRMLERYVRDTPRQVQQREQQRDR